MARNKFYIATSIPYVNAKPHMGHTMDVLYGDVLARYYRAVGYEVVLQAGVDENGQKLYQKACLENKSPKLWISELRPIFTDFFQMLNISYDVFTQTSEPSHKEAAQELWRRAAKNGDIYKKKYKGLYCVGCESFKIPEDLVNGKCPDHLTQPEKIEEENYFFALSKYQQYLKKLLKENPDFIFPKNSYNEAAKMLERGLEDVSISRPKERLPWGVSVPDDPKHVMYVWFDALTNYLTALGFPTNQEKMKNFWPPDIEIVGKDNNRWHTLLWPAMLASGGLTPPKKVLVHYYILGKGGIKMSKTIGNVVDPVEVMKKYGSDPLRYYILTKIPMDADGAIDFEHFEMVYNTELANDLGNLVQRVLSMIKKYNIKSTFQEKKYYDGQKDGDKKIHNLDFAGQLDEVWKEIRGANKEIDEKKPWDLAKNNPSENVRLMKELYDRLSVIAAALAPFLPETSEKIKNQLKTLKPIPLFPRLEK